MRSVKKKYGSFEKYYADSLPMLQANLYTTLIEGRIPEEEMPHYLRITRLLLQARGIAA